MCEIVKKFDKWRKMEYDRKQQNRRPGGKRIGRKIGDHI